jgi:hypothetical protein
VAPCGARSWCDKTGNQTATLYFNRRIATMDTPTMITMDLRTFEELSGIIDDLSVYLGELTDRHDIAGFNRLSPVVTSIKGFARCSY